MQRILHYPFVLVFCSSCLFAQNKTPARQSIQIDSLTNLLKTDKEDTNKVNHLDRLGDLTINIPGKDTFYSFQAIKLGQKLNFQKGIANGYFNLGDYNWIRAKNNASAINYYLQAATVFKQSGDIPMAGDALTATGDVYCGLDSFNTSLKYYFEAFKIDPKSRYTRIGTLNNIGNDYISLGDYPNALKYYLDALNYTKKPGNPKRISIYLDNIGAVYSEMKDYKNALIYLDSALNMTQKIGYKNGEKLIFSAIAATYRSEKKYTEALDYGFQGLELSKETNAPVDISYSAEEIGEIYMETGDYAKALEYEEEALKASEESKYPSVIIESRGVIGEIYLKEKNYKEAEKYLLAAITSAQGAHELNEEKNYQLNLSQLYSAIGQYKKSLDYYIHYDSLKDSLFNQNTSRQIGKIEAKSEYDKQLATQQADEDNAKAIADAKNKRQQIISLIIALIAIIIALIAFTIYRSLRIAKREKIMVEKEKILMELKALRAQMNPHFIFNAINSIQNFILGNDLDAAQKHLSRFSKLMRMVLENSSYENIPLADEIKMLELYLEFETVRFSSRFNYKIIVDASIDKDDTFISPLIIQPYAENAIWHGLMHLKDRQGEVSVHFEAIHNQLKCTIDDNGIGREKSLEIKKKSVHKSMGLSITSERIEIINALFKSKMSINFTDKLNGGGTKVELLMPLIVNA